MLLDASTRVSPGGRAKDTDGVGDDLREYLLGQQLGDADAVLVFDETGGLKKGVYITGTSDQMAK